MDQTPRPDESRDDHQDHQRDLDAEFAALMGDVEIPDDLSDEDLGAVQEAGSEPGRQTPVEDDSVSTGSTGESGPADIRPNDVPHNTYHPLNGGQGRAEDAQGSSRLTDAQEAQIAAAAASLSPHGPPASPCRRRISPLRAARRPDPGRRRWNTRSRTEGQPHRRPPRPRRD